MNRKLFKRLLIATSMIAPVAMVTPMILTSCNDNGAQNPIMDKNAISLGKFNDLLKTRPVDKSKPQGPQEFWLDVIDFHGNSFLGSDTDKSTQVREFYQSLLGDKSKVVEKLTKQGFVVSPKNDNPSQKSVDYNNVDKITFIKTKDVYQSRTDSASTLASAFKGLHLSNIFDEGVNNPDNNATGIITNWNNITEENFKELLKKIDVNCEITINNRKVDSSLTDKNEISKDIKNSNSYSIVYTFTPKGDCYWSGFSGDISKAPLKITLNDYVDNLNIIDNYSSFNVKETTLITDPITAALGENTLEFNATTELTGYDSKDNVKTKLNEVLGITIDNIDNIGNGSNNKNPIDLSSNIKFVNFINDNNFAKDNNKKFEKLNSINTKTAIDKNRITAKLYSVTHTDAVTGSTPKPASTNIKILISSTNISQISDAATSWNPDYTWFLNFDDAVKQGINTAKICYSLTINNKTQ